MKNNTQNGRTWDRPGVLVSPLMPNGISSNSTENNNE